MEKAIRSLMLNECLGMYKATYQFLMTQQLLNDIRKVKKGLILGRQKLHLGRDSSGIEKRNEYENLQYNLCNKIETSQDYIGEYEGNALNEEKG